MTMLTDGLKSQSLEDKIKQMDVAELLEQSCIVEVDRRSEPGPRARGAGAGRGRPRGVAPMPKCPICEVPAKPRAENAAFPFCSPRCKAIDLGKWLDEEYRIPTAEPPAAEDEREPPDRS